MNANTWYRYNGPNKQGFVYTGKDVAPDGTFHGFLIRDGEIVKFKGGKKNGKYSDRYSEVTDAAIAIVL